MFATAPSIGKTFEIWPAKLTFAAGGAGARDALDAAMDAARELSSSVVADAELLAKGAMNVLPRGKAGGLAIETVSAFRDVCSPDLPPLLAALPGAVCDTVLDVMLEVAQACVREVLAQKVRGARLERPPVLHERLAGEAARRRVAGEAARRRRTWRCLGAPSRPEPRSS